MMMPEEYLEMYEKPFDVTLESGEYDNNHDKLSTIMLQPVNFRLTCLVENLNLTTKLISN